MPSISMFFGIIIYMYRDDHRPPHFHAFYQDFKAVFSLNGELMEGRMPHKQCAFIKAWALLHEEELKANWKLAEEKQALYKIDPLR